MRLEKEEKEGHGKEAGKKGRRRRIGKRRAGMEPMARVGGWQ